MIIGTILVKQTQRLRLVASTAKMYVYLPFGRRQAQLEHLKVGRHCKPTFAHAAQHNDHERAYQASHRQPASVAARRLRRP